nr:MAG TPA: hypothetical protein [Caudoviricetes sp.]
MRPVGSFLFRYIPRKRSIYIKNWLSTSLKEWAGGHGDDLKSLPEGDKI